MLKDLVHQFQNENKIFDLQKRHNSDLDFAMKNSFFWSLHYRCFYVCNYYYFVNDYINSPIHNMQTC